MPRLSEAAGQLYGGASDPSAHADLVDRTAAVLRNSLLTSQVFAAFAADDDRAGAADGTDGAPAAAPAADGDGDGDGAATRKGGGGAAAAPLFRSSGLPPPAAIGSLLSIDILGESRRRRRQGRRAERSVKAGRACHSHREDAAVRH